MKVIIEVGLAPRWGTEEDLDALSDDELVEMLREDVALLLDGATWTIERGHHILCDNSPIEVCGIAGVTDQDSLPRRVAALEAEVAALRTAKDNTP